MAEIVAAAGECEHGALHLWPEVGWLEFLNGETRAAPGEPGDLVGTGLLNQDMPLIRYQVGDRAVLAPLVTPAHAGARCPDSSASRGGSTTWSTRPTAEPSVTFTSFSMPTFGSPRDRSCRRHPM